MPMDKGALPRLAAELCQDRSPQHPSVLPELFPLPFSGTGWTLSAAGAGPSQESQQSQARQGWLAAPLCSSMLWLVFTGRAWF